MITVVREISGNAAQFFFYEWAKVYIFGSNNLAVRFRNMTSGQKNRKKSRQNQQVGRS